MIDDTSFDPETLDAELAESHSHQAQYPATDLRAGLTEPQLEAVTHINGPFLLLAGAGAGKTRVITRRAALLATTVAKPWEILAITFTNKAANEMKERVLTLGIGDKMNVSTFHAFCAKLLRIHHTEAGLQHNYTIADQSDRKKIIKEALQRAEISTANLTPAKVEFRISSAKSDMISPEAMLQNAEGHNDRLIGRIYTIYEEILTHQNALDFDDLLLKTATLLTENDDLRRRLENQYRYVLVDEYQDTNEAQYRIAHQLTREHGNLFVTGDPDQAIYGWRGANIQNILSFEKDYPNAKTVRLEQNYRSTKRILAAASQLITANIDRKEKTLWTDNEQGDPVRVIRCEDNNAEAASVVTDIKTLISQGVSESDIAIFVRINALSRSFEEQLFSAGIPYRIARGVAFYARKEIKDVLAYLRLIINPSDDVSLERIINTPTRGIGKKTIDHIKAFANASSPRLNLLEAVHRYEEIGLAKRAHQCLKSFSELLHKLAELSTTTARHTLEQTLSLSGLMADLNQTADIDAEPLQNIEELVSAASEFDTNHPDGTILDWLTFTSLLGDEDLLQGGTDSVTIMTLHAAKGLEFPAVYIIGVEHGLLPMIRFGSEDADDIEEERRLLFVGMTRAKKRLTLTFAARRMLHGMTSTTIRSTFLDELPHNEIQWLGDSQAWHVDQQRSGTAGGGWAGSSARSGGIDRLPSPRKPAAGLPEDIDEWQLGSIVRHPAHGLGVLIDLSRGARRSHVKVRFKNGMERAWILEFANLHRVDFDEVTDEAFGDEW